ncbi:Hypothetical protein, putative, partial [Bodo saltans]
SPLLRTLLRGIPTLHCELISINEQGEGHDYGRRVSDKKTQVSRGVASTSFLERCALSPLFFSLPSHPHHYFFLLFHALENARRRYCAAAVLLNKWNRICTSNSKWSPREKRFRSVVLIPIVFSLCLFYLPRREDVFLSEVILLSPSW